MNSNRLTLGLVVVVFLLGLTAGAALLGNLAVAQVVPVVPAEPAPTAGRYQISAYAATTRNDFGHGCYVVDTATGAIWHARAGAKAERVAAQLP